MTRPLRVALDARFLTAPVLRGMDRYTVGLTRELVRRGVHVTLLHRAREPLHPPHVAGLGCDVQGLPDRSGVHWEQVVVPFTLWRRGFDLYHAPAERGVPWWAPCPVVLTCHSVTAHSYHDLVRRGQLPGRVRDYLGYDYKPHDRRFVAWYHHAGIHRAAHLLTPSEFSRREIIRFLGVPSAHVTMTPLAVHEQFRRAPRPAAARAELLGQLGVRRPYLLYVGGYEPHKNVPGLLEAFALVRAARPDLALVLVGSKMLPDALRASAARFDLRAGRDVFFLVNLGEELTDLYDGAELFVTLSWRETFCLPALEAMTRGVPVVTSAWGAGPEVVGDAGRLVDPRDPAAACRAILDLLAADRAALREQARLRADHFSWARTARLTLNVYHRLLAP